MTVVVDLPVDILHELERRGRVPATDVNHLQNTPAFTAVVAYPPNQFEPIEYHLFRPFLLGERCRVIDNSFALDNKENLYSVERPD